MNESLINNLTNSENKTSELSNKSNNKMPQNIEAEQSLIGSIDYKSNNNIEKIMIQNGKKEIKNDFKNYINFIIKNGVGEIYLNSIDRDGTGQGMDLNIINKYKKIFKIPTILVGGAGNANHFYDAILNKEINAVATANLYNFVGNGLKNARNILINKNIDLPKWEY